MFGTNRTVLRVGAGSSIDTEFGVAAGHGSLTTNIGEVSVDADSRSGADHQLRQVQEPADPCGHVGVSLLLLQRDGLEGGKRLLLQPDASSTRLFRGTMIEVGYVGNQARHLRNVMPFNMAMPEGYDKVMLQDGTPQPISGAPVTLPGSNVVFTGQTARRPYPQLVANVMMQPDGSMHYDSLQTKVERRFADRMGALVGLHLVEGHGSEFQRKLARHGERRAVVRAEPAQRPHAARSCPDLLFVVHLGAAVLQELKRPHPDDPGGLGGGQHHDRGVGPDLPGEHRDRHPRSRGAQ